MNDATTFVGGTRLISLFPRRFPKLMALMGSGLVLGTSLAVFAPALSVSAAQSSKLVVIPFENQSYGDIIGSSQAPYLNQLISQGTVFSQYTAVATGSNANYLAMTSGLNSALTPPSPNVFQAIDASSGLSWKAFMESMTGKCGAGTTGTVPGSTDPLYTTDHDPAYAYRGNTSCAGNDVPLTNGILNNLPSFSYLVPNECDDMHTAVPTGQSCPAFFGPNSGSSPIKLGDNWLSQVVPSLLADPTVTVLITWDEARTTTVPAEHVVTLEVGAGVTPSGIDGNAYTHYSLEAGLYRYFGLGTAPNNGATALPLPIPANVPPLYPGPSNAITTENSNPGTTDWRLTQQADDYNQQIGGYASATSVNLGQPITFYVSVKPSQSFTLDVYRIGYYQGMGGRFLLDIPNLAGVVQPACPVDSTTGMIACGWAASYQLTIPTSWVSGIYLAKLTNAAGYQNYIIFVVREDARNSSLLYQAAFNTYQAYNNWPDDIPPGSPTGLPSTGKSLYDYNSSSTLTSVGTKRAVQVSFDRPYADDTTAGGFLDYEINDVAWLEQQGYDVSYSSDVDTDLSGGNLRNHHGFISAGHDEYWSMPMFNAASSARDSGVNLAFLGADDVSWQVRYAPSASNVPDRILICYKSASLDPVQNNTVTVHFRDPQVNMPEQLLVGGTSTAEQLGSNNATPVAFVVQNPSNWTYANTGAFNGENVPNVVGYEIDSYISTYPSPTAAAGTYQLLSNSPIVNSNNQMVNQNATIYQAPSGAWVFSAATIEWGWALFNFGFSTGGQNHANYAQPFIQTMTADILNKFSAGTLPLPAAPTNLTAVPSASSINLSWTDNDPTATYQLDRSADPTFDTLTSVSLLAGATSYHDTGLSAGVYYYRLVAVGPNGKSPYVSASAATIPYAALVAGRAGLLAHWRLGEKSGTTAQDTTGLYGGTYVNNPTLGSSGAIVNDPNTAATFNGSTQKVTVPTIPSVGDFSIDGWSYLTSATINNNTLYGGNGTARLMPRPGTGSFLGAAYAGVTLNGTEYVLQPNSPSSNINTWVDWVLTRKGSLLTLYRNGVQIAQRSDLPATATANINGYIAAQNSGAYYLSGKLQDVALYIVALASDDVRDDYTTALNGIAPTPPVVAPNAPTNFGAVPSASSVSLSWTDPDATSTYLLYRSSDPSFATAVTISLPAGTTTYTDTGLGQGVVYYRVLAVNVGGQSSYASASASTIAYTSLVDGRSGLLAHWRLGETSGTTAWDTLGTYNGFYVSNPTLGSPGGIVNDPSTSATFNGTTQRVQLPALATGGDFSIEGWTYLTNASVNNNTLYGSSSLQLLARPGTGSYPTAAYGGVTLNGTTYVLQPTSPASNINVWVYWVLTRQGGALTLYRNGVQIAQRTDLPATATVSLSGYIADQSNGSYYLTGRAQDVAVYNRALSSLEVTNSYTAALNAAAPTPAPPTSTPYYNAVRSEPSLVAYWRLDEASGGTARDVLGKYNGTYVNGVTRGSPGTIVNDPDTSSTFNGSSQLVTLPSLPSVGDFTIEGWTNLTNATVNNNNMYGGATTVQFLARPGAGGFPTAAYAGPTLNGTAYILQPTSPASNINTWVYWTLTRQGGTLTLYRNAVQIGQRTDLPATATANISGYIGNQIGGLYYLTGGIDEVAVYTSALGPQAITSHYLAAQFGPVPHPTAAPSVSVTQPSNAGTYGANWPGSLNGTASSNSGFSLTGVSVAVRDTTTGQWWGGSGFTQANQTFIPVTSGTTNWSLGFSAGNLTSGHSYTVTAQATDYAGNVGTSAAVGFTYVSAPPSVSVSYPANATSYGTNWTGSLNGTASSNSGSSLATVSVAVQDTTTGQWWGGSGFNQAGQIFFPVTSGTSNWSLSFPATNLTSGHGYAVTAQATDTLGNTGSSSSVGFSYYSNAPSTSIACNGVVCSSSWYNAPVTVTLSATDPGGPGVSATYYTTDGSTPTTSSTLYTGAFTVSSTSSVQFFSVDRAGNFESVKSQQLQIDTVAPTTGVACNVAACSASPYHSAVSVTLSATDNTGGSGVSATYYTTDGSTPTTSSTLYTGAITVPRSSAVQFFSIDAAGNAESIKLQQVQITVILVSIAVTPATPSIARGTTQPFTATGTYSDGSSLDLTSSVAWTSSDTSVATITAGGLASGAAQGTSQISATSGGVTGSTTLTVGPAALVSIAVTPANPSIPKGTTQPFTATGTYSDGSTLDLTNSVSWSSSDPSVATITSGGLATALTQGSTTINASAGVTGSTTLTVGPAALVSIAVTPANPSVARGTTQQFAATGTYSDGSTQNLTGSATWASSNPAVATITAGGLASGEAQGTSQVSATSGGVTGSTTLTVGPAVLVSIAITPPNPSIARGTTQPFTATGTYSDGSTLDVTGSATWASSNPAVATITAGGLASGAAQGTSEISATSGAVTGSTSLTIGPPTLLTIAVTPTTPSIAKGTTQPFTATGTYSDGSTADVTSSVAWTSSNPAVATITAGGQASGVAPGTSQISATSGGVTGSTTLTVGPAVLVSIAVTPANPSIAKGTTQPFTATGTYSDGSTQDLTSSATWVSSNTAVATISTGGLASGAAPGTSQIGATSGGVTGSTTLTVGPTVLLSIAVTPASPSIPKGTTQPFTATGTYSDGSTADVTNSVSWSSADTSVATVTSGGVATALKQGSTAISASAGVTGSTTLTVGPALLLSIAVTPANPSIAKGTTQPFIATGTYSDGSTQDLTSSATWVSSNTAVATISTGGLASGAAPGTSQIDATSGGVTGSTTLTVGPAVLLSIAVTPASPSIPKGTTQPFTATGTYSDGSTADVTNSASWSSADTNVATITSAGLATGAGQGAAQINAASGGVTGSTTLTVGPALLVSIAVTPANPSIAKGTTQPFAATGTYSDGSTQNLTSSATWASSNPAVATISAGGLASGAAPGTSQIGATSGGMTGSTTLTVGPAVLVSIAVTPANPSVAKGTTQPFTATGTYSDGSTQDLTSSATWVSSNTTVSAITAGGLASGAAPGTSQISATSGGVTDSTTLTVGPAVLVSIAVTPANSSIPKGSTQPFIATGTYSDGSTLDVTSSATWASSNTSVATIGADGRATGVGQGAAQMSATLAGATDSTTLTVGPEVLVSIAATPANPSIPKGTTKQFTATGTYSDGSTQDLTSSATWASSNTAVATISTGGLASGAAQGNSQISATSGAVTGSTTLTVVPAVLLSIAVTPANPSIPKGTTQQFTATGTYSDASTKDVTASVTWASSNPGVANISSGGLTTGAAQGSSQISATSGTVTGGTTLTVAPATLVSIGVTPPNPTIAKGTTQQFTATGTYSDGSTQDLTSSTNWASSNAAVASVNASGLASGAAQGTSQISATVGGATGSTTLTVGPAVLVSIAVTPANPTIAQGSTQQFTATGNYSDGSMLDVTSASTWVSSNTAVATITSGALASGAAQGTTQMSATLGAVTGSTALTVGPAVLVSIAVTPATPSIAKGTTQQFAATGTYSDGSTQTLTSSATWVSSNTAVATITAGGLASGAGQGTSQVSATSGGVTGSTTLTVGPPTLVSIAVTPATPSIPKGSTRQFTATGTYTDASTLDVTASVTWASSNTALATISAGGLATGVAQGTSQVSATLSGVTGSTTLTIGPAALVSIAVTPANPSIASGSSQQFTATGTYTDASTQNLTNSVSWASSNTGVATITSGGLATAVAQSTSEISATSGPVTGSTTLTVGPAVLVSIAVTPANPSIPKGRTQQFTATGTFSDGSTQNLTTSASWVSSNTTVATVSASGVANGAAQGTSTISASSAGVTGSATLTVGPAILVSIAVTPANPSIPKGTTKQFTPTGTYSDGSTLDLAGSVTWASSRTSVATITTAGLATAKAQGTSQISARLGSVTGSTTLTVTAAALVSIAVTPANQSVSVGTKVQYAATGKYTDGSTKNLTTSVTWTSSDTTVATITSAGVATALKSGIVTISARSGSVIGSTSLTVR